MSSATQAVLLNGLPLLVLAGVNAALTVAILPVLWRERARAHTLDWALVCLLPGIAVAAGSFGAGVVLEEHAIAGHLWVGLAVVIILLAPPFVLLLRVGDRAFVVGAIGRSRFAEQRVSLRDRELVTLRAISNELAAARTRREAARVVVARVADLVEIDFAGLALVDESGRQATGLYAELNGEPAPFWEAVRVDLEREPSGIATAVRTASPFTVEDVSGSTLVSPRLAAIVGAQSGAWVPMIAEGLVTGVLVLGATEGRRSFDAEELALLQAVASDAGLAVDRLRSAEALAAALDENRLRLAQQAALLHAAHVVTSELELDAVPERLVEELMKLFGADVADCYLLDRERGVLRLVAAFGLGDELAGFEFVPQRGVAGEALAAGRPVVLECDETPELPVPHAAYGGLSRALVAPIAWGDEALGVLGIGTRQGERRFSDFDLELLEAFASLAALALRNAETFADRSRQTRIQQGFYRIATLLGEPVSLDRAFDAAAEAATDALGGDFAAMLAGAPRRFAVVGSCALPAGVRELELPEALRSGAADGQIVAVSDVATDGRFAGAWRRAGFSSLLAIPVPGEQAGLAIVFFVRPRSFSRDDLELAQQLASAARGALDRSRLFEAERTARSVSQQLARTGSMLAAELDPPAVLEAVVGEAQALVGADAAAVASLEEDEIVVTAVSGDIDDALGTRTPATGWVAGDVLQSRAPVAYDDVSEDPMLVESDAVLAGGHRAYLGVPLVAPGGVLHGVLSVYAREPRPWRDEEVQALVALATNASVALSNAELYQRVAVEREQSVAILANTADGIVAVDREGGVVLWNRAAEEITGVPASEAVGRTPEQVLQQELQSEAGGTNRLVSIRRGEADVWLALSEALMRDPSGAVAGRIFVFRDISAERAVEQMKSDFVSTVSVELRAPLTSIYGFSQTLLREDVAFGEPERRTFLDFISRESERLTKIVDALLSVARIDTGDLSVNLEPTDVGGLLAEVVSSAAEATNGHLIVAEVGSGGVVARADPGKLRQVLEQLISNAVKYSPGGGTVTVSARVAAESVEIAVADEGIGIAAAERERIFGKFYKAGSGPGTGLGLFIAQGLVREMGGRLSVESEAGRGSRFAFELPLAVPDM